MAVVSNSSPLIAFAAIGQLSLHPAIFQSILIPPAVAAEITPSIPALPSWLHVEDLKQPLHGLVLQRSLGAGTAGVLLKESFFIGPELYDELVRLAGEADA